jgi:hypothetical protein
VAALAVLAGALALAGCAALGARGPEDIVRERAQARWNALLAGKFEDAYAYLSPSSRAVVSLQRFRSSFGSVVAWKSAEVHKVECKQTDRCIVSIKVRYQPMMRVGGLSTIETSVEETWLLDGGQWWLPQGL